MSGRRAARLAEDGASDEVAAASQAPVSGVVRITVPATSANLGPGYDSFGIALGRYDEVVARRSDGPLRIRVDGCGADDVPRTAEHLVYRSAMHGFDRMQVPRVNLDLLCRNEIPHGGGQGSSAAAIVAGLAVARALTPDGEARMPDALLLDIAAGVEGHPDNAAPAVLGGFTLSWMDSTGHAHVVRRAVHPDVRAVMFGAAHGSSTARARALLPATVPHSDATANTAAGALLMHALTCEPALLFPATVDQLHQKYRAASLPETTRLLTDLRAAGVAAVVSGAGPSVLAFCTEPLDLAAWRRPGFVPVELPVDTTGVRTEHGVTA